MKSLRKVATIALVIALLVVSAAPAFAATSSTPLKSIALSKTSGTINKGDTITLKVTYNPANTTDSKAVTWTSSNAKVAYVSGGRVKGMAPGTATITAKCGNKTATFKVTVKAPITSVSMNVSKKTITAGEGFGITVSYAPANTTDSKTITWTSSNNKVATVKNGYVTGLNAGTATITAKMGTKTATCTVTVKALTLSVADCYTQLNNYRTKAGAKKLTKDTALENIAKQRAKEIVSKFEHKTYYTYNKSTKKFVKGSTLRSATDLIKDVKGNVYRGENIAKGQRSCAEVSKAWYNSEGHRKNMLNKNFTKVGIAVYVHNGTPYWVQIFSS